jgi:hypothetical protein
MSKAKVYALKNWKVKCRKTIDAETCEISQMTSQNSWNTRAANWHFMQHTRPEQHRERMHQHRKKQAINIARLIVGGKKFIGESNL